MYRYKKDEFNPPTISRQSVDSNKKSIFQTKVGVSLTMLAIHKQGSEQ